MRVPASLLLHRTATAVAAGETSSSIPRSTLEEQQAARTTTVDADMFVILASLLCALVCVLGLALLSRCACHIRRRFASSSSDHSPPPPKGLKRKEIDALPTVVFASTASQLESSPAPPVWSSSSECAICLAKFSEGEGLRVLPRCGHGFHVACVDAWLRTQATCPSCRAAIVAVEPAKAASASTLVVVVPGEGSRCGRCGEVAPPAGGGNAACFLP